MATKREIQEQIAKLNADLETADDDDDFVEVYRVRKSAIPWLFQQDGAPEGESENETDGKGSDDGADKTKDEPKPKSRNKYFGG